MSNTVENRPELLEDPDGSPYPEPVQTFLAKWSGQIRSSQLPAFRQELAFALESLASPDCRTCADEGWVRDPKAPEGFRPCRECNPAGHP